MEAFDNLLQAIETTNAAPSETLKQQLVQAINHLIEHRFNTLLQILYRLDIDEQRLKNLLKEAPEKDAAIIITDLIMKRQQEKKRTQALYKNNPSIPDEEKW